MTVSGRKHARLAALPVALAASMAMTSSAAQDAPVDPATELDRVDVRGVRASLISALVLKQGAMQVVDTIVAEDIGKFPDNNLVEALQRVTGIAAAVKFRPCRFVD